MQDQTSKGVLDLSAQLSLAAEREKVETKKSKKKSPCLTAETFSPSFEEAARDCQLQCLDFSLTYSGHLPCCVCGCVHVDVNVCVCV